MNEFVHLGRNIRLALEADSVAALERSLAPRYALANPPTLCNRHTKATESTLVFAVRYSAVKCALAMLHAGAEANVDIDPPVMQAG